jgi:VCBS repeat-containing protein
MAAQVDCDSVYCFTQEDFAPEDDLAGICITSLPDPAAGTVMLGSRVIREGDILTAQQLADMTFCPLLTENDTAASVTYLPIYEDHVAPAATMSIAVRGKLDNAPIAQDLSLETYKNLANQGTLKVTDPEGDALTYSLQRKPKRGEVTLDENGNFLYTPKKNKVGVDSFTYTATDPAGNVSREATVTIQILKPLDNRQYTDTAGKSCRFAAEWMRNTGLFAGESVGNQLCFRPNETVSRGDFIAMVVQTLGIPTEDTAQSAVPADTPLWLRSYLAAAIRSGLVANLPATDTGSFEADRPITGAEAAVMLQNVLALTVSQQVLEDAQAAAAESKTEVPAWASVPLTAMAESGITLVADDTMTRGQVAQLLYQVKSLADTAPGMQVIRMQK